MPRYAVKLCEIHLIAERPITDEQRKEALEHFREYPREMILDNVAKIVTPGERS